MPQLVIEGAQTVRLVADPCVAGRLASCGLTLEGEGQASRKHFQVVPRAGRWVAEDLGSRNGTFLNGEKLSQPSPLSHGDLLRVGDTEVRYESAAEPLSVGTVLGGCTLTRAVGRSRFGTLYEATQGTLERPVTVEVADPDLAVDPSFKAFYEQRARLGGSFDSPLVRAVFDTKQVGAHLYTVFERLSGPSLAEELSRRAFDRGEVLELLEQAAAALAVVHKQGKLHGTFGAHALRRDEPGGKLKLCELGDEPRLRAHRPDRVEMARYASPEEARGHDANHRSDIYALGVLGYRLLAGRFPYEGKVRQVLTDHGSSAPVPLPEGLGPELEGLLAGALDKVAGNRPGAAELAERLSALREGGAAQPAETNSRSRKKSARRKQSGRLSASSSRGAASSARRARPTSSGEQPRAPSKVPSGGMPKRSSSAGHQRPQRRPLTERSSGGFAAIEPDPPALLVLRLVLLGCGYVLIALAVSALTRIVLRVIDS
ncbi:MAG TPA: hypothetical protein DEA08_39065 [Planctomycetes bacterium]|nr:hypothetical protein [Planctomycetota bacterium]